MRGTIIHYKDGDKKMIEWIAHSLNRFWWLIINYRFKGHLFFIGRNIIKLGFLYGLVIVGLIFIGKFIIDLKLVYGQLTNILTDPQVLIIFTVSEATLGLLPPDLFIMWTAKFSNPFSMLFYLGVLSYGAGIIAYYIGIWISRINWIKKFLAKRLARYILITKKWGGAFIAIAALFPFTPFPLVIIGVSVLKYPINKLLLYGLFRVIRFLFQGVIMLNALDL